MRMKEKEDIKRIQTALLEMKTKVFKIKRIMDGIRYAEENTSKFEVLVIGTILNEGRREGGRELKLINRISLSCVTVSTGPAHMAL